MTLSLTHSTPYFIDATLVIQSEQTLFRVYPAILAAQSSVFRDMLTFPHPGHQDGSARALGEYYEPGCPLVVVHDKKEDMEVFLDAIYDSSFLAHPEALPSATITALLRLGRKYDVPHLERRGICELSKIYPTTLDAWDGTLARSPRIDSTKIRRSRARQNLPIPDVLALIREFDLVWMLPALLYQLCSQSKTDYTISAEKIAEWDPDIATTADLLRARQIAFSQTSLLEFLICPFDQTYISSLQLPLPFRPTSIYSLKPPRYTMSLPPVPPYPYPPLTQPQYQEPQQQPQQQNQQPPQFTFVESPPHFDNPLVAPRPHRVDPQIGANVSLCVHRCWRREHLIQRRYIMRERARLLRRLERHEKERTSSLYVTYAMSSCDWALCLWGWCWDDWDEAEPETASSPPPSAPTPRSPRSPSSASFPPVSPSYTSTTKDKMNADASSQMARDLDASTYVATASSSYNAPTLTPGSGRTPSPLPPPQGSDWSPWAGATGMGLQQRPSTAASMSGPGMDFRLPTPPRDGTLTVALPSLSALNAALTTVTQPSHDPQLQLAWARDVMFLVDRTPTLASSPLALAAVPLILSLAQPPSSIPEAVYLRATFAASGAYPNHVPASPRAAFRDFEAAARAGYAAAWFRLARDYEAFSDNAHAIDCLNRGAKARDPASLHRLGTAHLLAQLGLPADLGAALPNLHQAACRATLQCPQPAYVFALILLSEFNGGGNVPTGAVQPFLPPGESREGYARKMLERAAALHFAPAQYKLGHAFEFAVPASAFPFDPLLSVQWYSLASQAGEAEADMALSKWFLCGAEGAFDKDESLARTFAEKAASKGLASAEFAMGYYAEVGIGGPKDVPSARSWYTKAAGHGNADARERLTALQQPAPQTLGRQEHDTLTENKLMRKRTQARIRSDEQSQQTGLVNPHPDPYEARGPQQQAQQQQQQQQRPPPGAYNNPNQRRTQVMELARKSSIAESSHYRGASTSLDYRAPSQPQQQPQRQRMGSNSNPPREGSVPPNRMPPREPSVPPGATRYSLADPGAGRPGSGQSSRPGSAAGASVRPMGTPPMRRPGANATTGTPGPKPSTSDDEGIVTKTGGGGPATFAEMGFTGAKAEDKECVVM
ncbi:unnamed protein product [Mycena citricolor]|uniref:BTB domain-containing protein n=1 Tax=Mycena citricolor TaxID=2018698 RepID=A0AAD2HCI2_9AGAR|nr:unnamed protein product [Mycena citricolor]